MNTKIIVGIVVAIIVIIVIIVIVTSISSANKDEARINAMSIPELRAEPDSPLKITRVLQLYTEERARILASGGKPILGNAVDPANPTQEEILAAFNRASDTSITDFNASTAAARDPAYETDILNALSDVYGFLPYDSNITTQSRGNALNMSYNDCNAIGGHYPGSVTSENDLVVCYTNIGQKPHWGISERSACPKAAQLTMKNKTCRAIGGNPINPNKDDEFEGGLCELSICPSINSSYVLGTSGAPNALGHMNINDMNAEDCANIGGSYLEGKYCAMDIIPLNSISNT